MPASLAWLFACAAGMSVANVYYAQALLDALAVDFSISHAAVGAVITATQAGCALALFLLVPLGDLVERRRLMLVQALLLVVALVAVGCAQSPGMLLAAMLLTGLLGTAMTQGLIAYAASSAGEHERGRIVGATQGGVFTGLLLARVFAGAISDLAGWRSVYLAAAAAMLLLAALMWRGLPRLAGGRSAMTYRALLASMLVLLRRNRVLQVRGVIALLMFAAFNVFWSALVLALSAPPYGYSHTAIGAFGLIGAVGALAAARAGRLVDQGRGQQTSLLALVLLCLAWLPLSFMHLSPLALVAGIVLLDLGGQAIHVTNQGMIFRTSSEAHGRLVGAYMLFYALGSGMGAMGATLSFTHAGWSGVCILGAAISLLALLFWAATRDRQMAGAGR
ncbi:MFS transporter [Massilia sp. IC2-476]|uniref:MFS transporter n=1 Tax=Massilia sp. IC2-476 TaxID=2887199 RepID=UPI001D108E9D|nr:MFS transporter [Massilia sp. IC2-476]MCC2970927.1 MFS transporter [Massilia sp. IC2-476]